MLQTYNIPPLGRIVNAKASFFRYESASAGGADESLRVRADGNDLGTYLPGDSITLPVDAKAWEITPVTPTATAVVRLGVGGVESSRIFGNVKVIDQGTDKTTAGTQFLGVVGGTQYAGQYTLAGIRANSKNVSVKRLQISNAVAGNIVGVIGTGMTTANPTTAGGMPNKMLNGDVSNATRFGGSCAGQIPTTGEFPGASWLWSFAVEAGKLTEIPLTTPIVIPAGFFLGFVPPATNTNVLIVVDFEEV